MKKTIMLLGIFVSAVLFASPQRGNSAAKSLVFSDDDLAPTAADYVQSGLVNFWDGIENADWGIHTDDKSIGWVDLAGNAANIVLTDTTVFWESTSLTRVGTWGRVLAYPTIDLTDPLSERTFEFVVSAEDLPSEPASTYYFWALKGTSSYANRLLWTKRSQDSIPYIWGTIRASAGNAWLGTSEDLLRPCTVSMVGTSEPSTVERNWGYYYFNGIKTSSGLFGGNPYPEGTDMALFAAVRNWPASNTIRFHSIRIYNRALTAEEVAHNHLIDRLRFNLP